MEKMKETIVPVAKLIYTPETDPRDLPKINNAEEVYKHVLESWDKATINLQQEVKIVLLSRNSRVLKIVPLFKGGMTETLVDPRLVFITALAGLATRIILVTNRITGNLDPSSYDTRTARTLKDGGTILQIQFLDFVLLSAGGYYSFADNGNL